MAEPTIQWDVVGRPESFEHVDVQKMIDDLHHFRLIECEYADASQTHVAVEIAYKHKGERKTVSPLRSGSRFDYPNTHSQLKVFLSANTGWESMFSRNRGIPRP